MKQWNELTSKGGKMQRVWRAATDNKVRKPIDKLLENYIKTKNAELLEKARNYLIEHKVDFSTENQKRIDYFLS